jgi:arylsulfatase A-like enzyme
MSLESPMEVAAAAGAAAPGTDDEAGPAQPARIPTAAIARPGLAAAIAIAVCFGAAAGVLELGVIAYRKLVEHQFVLVNLHALWLAPLSYMLLLAPLGVVIGIGARWLPARAAGWAAFFLPALVATGSVLFLWYPALHPAAIALLALGAATQCARSLAPRLPAVGRWAPRAVGALALALMLAFGGVTAWYARVERQASALMGRAAAGAPNIILIVLDTVHALELGLYGEPLPTTPFIDRYARGGVVFDAAFSSAPWTLVSHASMFTGRYPHELSAGWLAPLDNHWPTLAERLRAHGYRTGGFVANVEYAGVETGLSRGFVHYDDVHESVSWLLLSSSLGRIIGNNPRLRKLAGWHDVLDRKHASALDGEVLAWVEDGGRAPVFLFMNYLDAHEPYVPSAKYWNAFAGGLTRRQDLIRFPNARRGERAFKASMTPAQVEAERRAHLASLAELDAGVGVLLDGLRRRGLLDNAVVVITADHGEQFGEHHLFSHGNSLYSQLLHVPLVVVAPGRVPAGLRAGTPVSLRDLGATILDLAGIRDPAFPGASLAGAWTSPGAPAAAASPVVAEVEPAPREALRYPAAKGPMRSVVLGHYQYIRRQGGPEELYDYVADRAEADDRVHDPALAPVVARARLVLDSMGAWRTNGARALLRPGQAAPGPRLATP